MTLISLDFAVCESRKALIYKGSWRAGKTPKAGVAGSIPAGRAIQSSHVRPEKPGTPYRSRVSAKLKAYKIS
jgi:hypothetical protein